MIWTTARVKAEARGHFGLKGYLATITSAGENDLICQRLQADAWIGASDAAVEGKWVWVTGPEAGKVFSVGNINPVCQPGMYMNWNNGEPNDAGGEDYGEIYSSSSIPGRWNDLPNSSALGYVVE